jgi:hypothetical protein
MPVEEIRVGKIRAIAAQRTTSKTVLRRVVKAAMDQTPLPGLPPDILGRELITISLAVSVPDGIDGWAVGSAGVVVLRLSDVTQWSYGRLRRVLRHELTHIALDRYLGMKKTAKWFSEGLAEWVAGGLTCAGEARIRLALQLQAKDGASLPSISEVNSSSPRLSYDLFASFFEFLATTRERAMMNGSLLARVREIGMVEGIKEVIGYDMTILEPQWRSYLQKLYGGPLREVRACDVVG